MAKTQLLICPYCGEAQPLSDRCRACKGLFEPLSRQATHNSMGPWFIRDTKRPHRPGCSYETMVRLIERGQIDRFSIIRGPTTRQFWAVAKRVPGVAHLLGYCHNCDAHVEPTAHGCPKCGMAFSPFLNRNYLGLPDIRPLPWEAELDLNDRKGMPGGNGEGNGSAAMHSMSARVPQRNVGISSFATDEELMSAAPPAPARPTSVSASSAKASPATEEPEFVDVPGEEPGLREEAKALTEASGAKKETAIASAGVGGVESDRLTRTLRSTVLKQRRTIRLLTLVVVIVALASAMFGIVLVQMLGGDDGAAGETKVLENQNAIPQTTTSNAAPKPVETTAPDLPKNDSAAENASKTDGSSSATAQPPTTTPTVDPTVSKALASIEEARTLHTASADEKRPLDDRIADCESALTLLESAEQSIPANALPADFANLISRVRTDLERLRLSKFFP